MCERSGRGQRILVLTRLLSQDLEERGSHNNLIDFSTYKSLVLFNPGHTSSWFAHTDTLQALNPAVDWRSVEEAYLGNRPVEIAYVDNFFSQPALDKLRDIALGSTIFFDRK